MADPKSIRILLVEDDPDDDQVLRAVVEEIVESPEWPNWHACEVIPSDRLCDALEPLGALRFDAILLNLSFAGPNHDAGHVWRDSRGRPDDSDHHSDVQDESLAHTLVRIAA